MATKTTARPRQPRSKPAAESEARPRDRGAPPSGVVDDEALEAAIVAWKQKAVKTKADYVAYPTKALLADAREMLTGLKDLPRFAAIKAPVGARDFAWLRLLTEALDRVTDNVVEAGATRDTLNGDAEAAIAAVRAARTRLARLAVAGGVNTSLLAITASNRAPQGVLAAADRVTRQVSRILDDFHDAGVAAAALAELEQAAERLRVVVYGREALQAETGDTNARRAALKRVLYDVLTHIGRWGIAAVGDDPARIDAYRLTNIFTRRERRRAPAPPPET